MMRDEVHEKYWCHRCDVAFGLSYSILHEDDVYWCPFCTSEDLVLLPNEET